MKIVIAIDHFKEGGAERVASVITNELCRKHEVHVLVMEEGINYPLDLEHVHYRIVKYNRANRVVRKLSKLYKLRKMMRDIDADVVFSFGSCTVTYTMWALWRLGRRKTIVIGSERTDPTKDPTNRITKWLRDRAYNACDILVCQTPWVVDYFKGRINTPCVIIPNPISPHLPQWQGSESKRIMTACRIVEQKNLPLLIRAFRRLLEVHPEWSLVVYGDGELKENIEGLIESYGLQDKVSMPGFSCNIPHEMINSYMYVSSSDYEGISNSMLEALGCGVPTICTDCPVGGAAMSIENGKSGLLTPVGDETALYEAMKRMIEDKGLAKRCSENARKINEALSADRIVSQWTDLINRKE